MMMKAVFKVVIFIFLMGITLFTSCKKDNTKSPSQLYAEEQELLERFKETKTYNDWFDEAELVIDSSDAKGSYKGLVYFQLKKGTGDTVLPGKRVGIRYTTYYISDSAGAKEPYLDKFIKYITDTTVANPTVYTAGQPNPQARIYVGLDNGIRYMNTYGTSRILFPSTIGGNDYKSRVIEVKVTYVGR